MAFLQSFIQYFVIMIILAVIALIGGFLGAKLRKNKDAKMAASTTETLQEVSEE